MPFVKIGPNRYRSPSGRVYNKKQVDLWYAGGGKFPGEKGPGEAPRRSRKAGKVTLKRRRKKT